MEKYPNLFLWRTGEYAKEHLKTIEDVDIIYKDKEYNVRFKFYCQTVLKVRTINKRTGAKLKRPVYSTCNELAVYVLYKKLVKTRDNQTPHYEWRYFEELEKELNQDRQTYTRENILKVVNLYKKGKKFIDVYFINDTALYTIAKNLQYQKRNGRVIAICNCSVDIITGKIIQQKAKEV